MASPIATQVVSPPRKLQASPRNITWATMIGLRAPARPCRTSQPQAISTAPRSTKKAAVVMPIAARADSMWAASRTPYPRSSSALDEHQPGGDDERWGRRSARVVAHPDSVRRARGVGGRWGRRRGAEAGYVTTMTKKDPPQGLFPSGFLATVEDALVKPFTSARPDAVSPSRK